MILETISRDLVRSTKPTDFRLIPGESAHESVQRLLRTSNNERQLDFALGGVSLDDEAWLKFLDELADAIGPGLLGLRLSCIVVGGLKSRCARLLSAAGVRAVEVAPADMDATGSQSTLGRGWRSLARLALVRDLADVDIAVEWGLELNHHGAGPDWDLLRRASVMASHIPAPSLPVTWLGAAGGSQASSNAIDAAVADWRESGSARSLLRARGPGFTRILDRREDDQQMRFTSLGRSAAAVLETLVLPRTPEEIVAQTGLDATDVSAVLEAFESRGWTLSWDGALHVSLVQRKRLEEKWSSGDQ